MKSFFARLRERQFKREIEKAQREGFEAGRRFAEIRARAEWAAAQVAVAERTGDADLIRTIGGPALAAIAEYNEALRDETLENARLARLTQSHKGEN
jgi:hypothetical protein